MNTYHFFALFLIIAVCNADETFELVSKIKDSTLIRPMFTRFLQAKPVFVTKGEEFKIIPEFKRTFIPDFAGFKLVNENERYEWVSELGNKAVDPLMYPAKKMFTYEAPVTYAPPRMLPTPPKPAYGEPPLVKPIFDYSMVRDLMMSAENFRKTGILKPGSYEYMSADGVPVSIKLFEN